MDVVSPLVDVQPITTSLDKLLDEHGGLRKENPLVNKKPSTLLFPSSNSRYPFSKDGINDYSICDWKSSSTSGQDDNRSSLPQLGGSTPTLSPKIENSCITSPEAWGGERLADRLVNLRQPLNLPSRLGILTSGALTLGSMFSTVHDVPPSVDQTSTSSSVNLTQSFSGLQIKDSLSNQDSSLALAEQSSSMGTRGFMASSNSGAPGPASLTLPRRLSYAKRISTTSSFSDGMSLSIGSPKIKKTGDETREELQSSLLLWSDISNVAETGILPTIHGGTSKPLMASQSELPQGNSFTLQLFQRTLEETLDSFQKSIHDDMRNLHIELLRQFHQQEMEFSSVMSSILETKPS